MPWIPNKHKGFTMKLDGERIEGLRALLGRIDELQKEEVPPEEWAEIFLDDGAELTKHKSYRNYTWSVTTNPGQETRFSYVEKVEKGKVTARIISVREWFKTREPGEE